MNTIIITSPDEIKSIVVEAINTAQLQRKDLSTGQDGYRKVSRTEAARLEGISLSLLDKIRDRYVNEKVGARKRLFLVKNEMLVKREDYKP